MEKERMHVVLNWDTLQQKRQSPYGTETDPELA